MYNILKKLAQIKRRHEKANGVESNKQTPSNDESKEEGFTCEICVETTPFPHPKFNSDKCSHPFCTECMINYIRVKLEDDHVGRIKCPALTCDNTLDPSACASLVGPSLFVRWCDVLCEEAIMGLDRCYCPYINCNVLIVNECGGIVRKSKCPECKRWFCFKCRRVWHAGFRCKKEGERRNRNDVAFGILAERMKWKRCPRCRHFVELRDGCRTVKCRCGMSFCYKCGKEVNQHFCNCDPNYLFGQRCLVLIMIACLLFLIVGVLVVVLTALIKLLKWR